MHGRKTGCHFQERLVLLFPSELPRRRLPSPALSAVKTQRGLAAVSKRLCLGPWLRRQCSFLSVIELEICVP